MGYIVNIRLHSQIIGSYFWWYLYSILYFQQTKYSLSATDRVTNLPTSLQIIRKSLFFFQQWSVRLSMSKKLNKEYTWNFDATLGKEKTYFKPSKWSRKKTNDICHMICLDKNRMTETSFFTNPNEVLMIYIVDAKILEGP